MATTQDSDADVEQEVTKKVDLICYLNHKDGETRRQFADRTDDSIDYFEKETETYVTDYYWLKREDVKIRIDEDEYERLKDVDTGKMVVIHEKDECNETDFKYPPRRGLKEMVKEVLGDITPDDEDLPFGWSQYWFGKRIKDADGSNVVYYSYGFESMPMLKHQSEISPDDMYEDEDEEFLAFKVKVKAKNLTKEQLEWVDENITSELMKRLGRHDLIDRVRTCDCEMETKEKGVCYNL